MQQLLGSKPGLRIPACRLIYLQTKPKEEINGHNISYVQMYIRKFEEKYQEDMHIFDS